MLQLPSERDPVVIESGDCLEVLKRLPGGVFDCVITDPPYCSGGNLEAQNNTAAQGVRSENTKKDGFKWFRNDNMGTAGLAWLLREMMVEVARLLKPDRSAFVFTDWRMVPSVTPAMESSGLRYRNLIVWDKGSTGLGNGFRPAHELILEFCNGSTVYGSKSGSNVIRVPRVAGKDKEHGAQKPVPLIRELIKVACPTGGLILDCFAGSGTTGVAAVLENRRAVLIESDSHHISTIQKRVARVTNLGLFDDIQPLEEVSE